MHGWGHLGQVDALRVQHPLLQVDKAAAALVRHARLGLPQEHLRGAALSASRVATHGIRAGQATLVGDPPARRVPHLPDVGDALQLDLAQQRALNLLQELVVVLAHPLHALLRLVLQDPYLRPDAVRHVPHEAGLQPDAAALPGAEARLWGAGGRCTQQRTRRMSFSALSSLKMQVSSFSNSALMRSATSAMLSFLSTIISRLSSMRSSQGDMRVTSTSSSGSSKYWRTNSWSSAMTVSCARRAVLSGAPPAGGGTGMGCRVGAALLPALCWAAALQRARAPWAPGRRRSRWPA